MRYRFRGLVRDTGKPVEGHVEADTEEFAFHLLANNGIVTEGLRPDPRPEDVRPPAPPPPAAPLLPPMGPMTPGMARPATPMPTGYPPQAAGYAPQAPGYPPQAAGPQATYQPQPGAIPADTTPIPGAPGMVNAIDSALDSSSSQIEFDALNEKFRGKKVWVIDREKIKRNVARVVDQALNQSLKDDAGTRETRERVAEAIEGLFKDNRNLTSQQNANSQHLDKQVTRLSNLLKQFETSLATMQMAVRGIGSGGGGGGGFTPRRFIGQQQQGLREEQNAVLLEIFKSNIELLRNMEDEMRRVNTVADAALEQPAEATNPAT
ncbi:MAG: hypothetical protein JWN24_288 [Phycisphaerales bacterium]|nr:hypothetical protein [Phycisphaerales bacterium]